MFLTILLIKYWLNNKKIILFKDQKIPTSISLFFGIGSAVLLIIHSIFLGIKFEYDLYKLFRRVVILFFIVFEIIAKHIL